MNKYRNKKVIVDGKEFDSKKEGNRYKELQNNYKIEYVADFKYIENGKKIVEDVKGMQTDVFKLKHKIFEKVYPDLELRIIK